MRGNMRMTLDEAQKLIRSLEEEREQLMEKMDNLSTFVVAISEGNPEEMRPEFDFTEIVNEIQEIDKKIRKIKHARNIFNTVTSLPEEDITLDEALILMAMLNNNYRYYMKLGNRQARERVKTSLRSQIIEYTYVNYNIEEARKYGKEMHNRMLEIQSKLNLVNSTYQFDVDI